jgi:two-component system, cell cycle sensor histidine kinase and response regulator CckA
VTKRVLLVDDDNRSLKLLSLIFESAGYQVSLAANGHEALESLVHQPVDLIITDILMPHADGYYLCTKVREDHRLTTIPIIVYSGTFTSDSEEGVAMQMGADAFLRKPAPKAVLLETARQTIEAPQHNRSKPATATRTPDLQRSASQGKRRVLSDQ